MKQISSAMAPIQLYEMRCRHTDLTYWISSLWAAFNVAQEIKIKSVLCCGGVATKTKNLKVCEVREREMGTGGFGDGGEIGRI